MFNCLKEEAKNAVSDLILTNENYKIAVNTLKERFRDRTILIEALESELFSLPASTDKSLSLKKYGRQNRENISSIRKYVGR